MTSMSVPAFSLAAVFLAIAVLLSACGSDPVRETTTTRQTTTTQGPQAAPSSTTTTTRTQQTTP